MKLSEFKTRISIAIPNIGQLGISDISMTSLINQACNAVNLMVKAYTDDTEFSVVANQKEYDLSVVAPSFVGRDKRGCFFKVDGVWKKIEPRSEAYLSQYNQNYLNSLSVPVPQYYYIKGNTFGLEPAADTAQVNGIKLFHVKRAVDMTNEDHYPYSGSTTEITALLPLDEAIIAWCKWRIAPAYGTVTDVDLKEREFMTACNRAEKQIGATPDISMSSFNRMRS